MHTVMAFLAALDPKELGVMTAGLTWVLIYLWRRFSIASWNAVTRQNPLLENLPAIVLNGLLASPQAFGKGFAAALGTIIWGAFSGGAMSVVGHHMLKDSPLPYQGAGPQPKPTDISPPAAA